MAETKEGGESDVAVTPAPKMSGWVVPVAVALIGAVTTVTVALINRPSAPESSEPSASSQPPASSPAPAAALAPAASPAPTSPATEAAGAEQLIASQLMDNGRYLSRWKVTTGVAHAEDMEVRVQGETNILELIARGPMGRQLFLDSAPGAARSSQWIVRSAPRVFEVSVQAEGKVPLRLSAVPR